MEETTSISINFDKLEDPRRRNDALFMRLKNLTVDLRIRSGNFRHKIMDILPITIIGIQCRNSRLCQLKTEEKSNEITAIPELPDILNVKGSGGNDRRNGDAEEDSEEDH